MAGYIGSQTPVVSNGSQRKYTFTATAAQTVFTGMDIPNPQQIQVFQNGVRLVITTDYTVSSGTTVTLVNAASAGDSLVVILFADYQLLDTDALTFTGGTTIEGDLTVDTNTLYVDSTNNRVGVGTASPSTKLSVTGGYISQVNAGVSTYLGEDGSGGSLAGTTSNHYFRFITNNTERLRILSSGGITFNGDTAAANALDDYEEGTWTPTDDSGAGLTFTFSGTPSYTKIGNLVFVTAFISVPSNSNTSVFKITGLPFTIATGGYTSGTAFNNANLGPFVTYVESTTQAFFVRDDNNNNFTNANLSGKFVVLGVTYRST